MHVVSRAARRSEALGRMRIPTKAEGHPPGRAQSYSAAIATGASGSCALVR